MLNAKNSIKRIDFQDVLGYLDDFNHPFIDLIKNIDDCSMYFYEIEYDFGEKIMKDGILYVPYKDELLSILEYPDEIIRNDLCYNKGTNPLTFIASNSIEIYKINNHKFTPHYGLLNEGSILGIWPIFEKNKSSNYSFSWDATSGSRSIFMLPNIGINAKYEKINEKFNSSMKCPVNNINHFDIFKKIYLIKNNKNPWKAKLFAFPDSFINKIKNNDSYSHIKNFLITYSFQNSVIWRNSFIIDLSLSIFLNREKQKLDNVILDTIRDILFISLGGLQGFSPCKDDSSAPIKLIEDFFYREYGLNYHPTIMIPTTFDMYNKSDPVYYSIEYFLSNKFKESKKNKINKIDIITQSIRMINRFVDEIKKDCFGLKGTNLSDIENNISFTPFHCEKRIYGNIIKSDEIPKQDSNFKTKDDKFCNRSTFLNGCIKISNK